MEELCLVEYKEICGTDNHLVILYWDGTVSVSYIGGDVLGRKQSSGILNLGRCFIKKKRMFLLTELCVLVAVGQMKNRKRKKNIHLFIAWTRMGDFMPGA